MNILMTIIIFSLIAFPAREATSILQRNIALIITILIRRRNKKPIKANILFRLWFKKSFIFLILSTLQFFVNFLMFFPHLIWFLRGNYLTIIKKKPVVSLKLFSNTRTNDAPVFRIILIHGSLNYYQDFWPKWHNIIKNIHNSINCNIEIYFATWRAKNNETIRQQDSEKLFELIYSINKINDIPTILIGHSYGGSIASHTTRLLKNSGQEAYFISIATPFVVLRDVFKSGIANMYSVLMGAATAYLILGLFLFESAKKIFGADAYIFNFLKYPKNELLNGQPIENAPYYIFIFAISIIILMKALFKSKKIYELGKTSILGNSHALDEYGFTIIAENDEVTRLSKLASLADELNILQRKIARYDYLLTNCFSNTSKSLIANYLLITIFIIILMASVSFFDIDYQIPGHSNFYSSSFIVITLTMLLTIVTNFWKPIRNNSSLLLMYVIFLIPNITNFAKQIFLSRFSGMRPWMLSFFLEPMIFQSPKNDWENFEVIKNVNGLAHSNILNDSQTANAIIGVLIKWLSHKI